MAISRVAVKNLQTGQWEGASAYVADTATDPNGNTAFNNARHAATVAHDLSERLGLEFRAETRNSQGQWVPAQVTDNSVRAARGVKLRQG
jgi:hypothetical protein